MSIWEPIGTAPVPEAPEEQPGEPQHCGCEIKGQRRNVLVDIDEGQIAGISCAICKLRLPPELLDDLVGVQGEDIPLVMTTTVEEYFHPLDMIRPEYDVWHTLTARDGQEAS